jgi:hypothetical protein
MDVEGNPLSLLIDMFRQRQEERYGDRSGEGP